MKKTYITPASTIVMLTSEDAVLTISLPQDEETADGNEALSKRKSSIWKGDLWDDEK